MKITKRSVEAALPKAGDYFLWDGDLHGFGCRIYPGGKRIYLVQYRKAGRSRRVKIGPHGPVTAEEARRKALELLGEVASGGDPAERRLRDRNAVTVKELCEEYLAATKKGLVPGKRGLPKKASTLATDKGRIERHIIPLLGRRRVVDLTSSDIARFIREVAGGKTAVDVRRKPDEGEKSGNGARHKELSGLRVIYSAGIKRRGRAIVEGGRGTAMRTMGLLSGILSFAVSEGIRPDNPVWGVPKSSRFKGQRRRVVLTAAQYKNLGEALTMAAAKKQNAKAVAQIRLIALTGLRRGEAAALRWAEINEGLSSIRLQDSKEGESLRPIGQAALEVLTTLDREDNQEFVFPADRGEGSYSGVAKAWGRVMKLSNNLPVDLTLHGLRHSFASTANELGYAEATIAAMLGHATRSQTGRYTHTLDNALVAAADRVARTIQGMMRGGGEVVPIARTKNAGQF